MILRKTERIGKMSVSAQQIHWLDIATELAKLSSCKKKHGALVVRSNNVLSVGINKMRNNPAYMLDRPSGISVHAEEQALKACRGDAGNSTIYVARVYSDGTATMSKPCKRCQKLMKAANVKNAVYTDWHGNACIMHV